MENQCWHLQDTHFQALDKEGPHNQGCWKIYEIYLALGGDVQKIM